jgi:arsenate reductase
MKKKILFVCVHNSCRSQIAEGFTSLYGNDIVEVKSGGTEVAKNVDSLVIQVMNEKGIDISKNKPKIVESWAWADRIVVMGCDAEESCPAKFLSNLENWDIENPKGKSIKAYRKVRDIIENKVKELIQELSS